VASNPHIAVSKFLSLVLRHRPDQIGIELDPEGWVGLDTLLRALAEHGRALERAELMQIVAESDKQRFSLSPDGQRIRANQGHSVSVELGYEPATPPVHLYHGTVDRFLQPIRAEGLKRGARHHVHLSATPETARQVGARRGHPVVLTVRAQAMFEVGHAFFISANGVWLTDHVPVEFLIIP
jgi:putative RNA 2'-phosphotransferase